jgi:hypothetical protein
MWHRRRRRICSPVLTRTARPLRWLAQQCPWYPFPMPRLRRLLFQLICPSVLLIGELQVWLANQARDGAGWRRSVALVGWVPCRAVFVAGYGVLMMLDEAARQASR